MAVARRDPMEVIESIQRTNRSGDRSAKGPTVAVNGYVYGSRNHPSSMLRPRPGDPGKPQNVKGIIHTLDKARANQEKLRRQKEKYGSFVVEPMMGRPVFEAPGIGMKQAQQLQQQGIRKATELREIYLDMGKKEFINWMTSLGIDEANAKECSAAIHDWCETYIKLPR